MASALTRPNPQSATTFAAACSLMPPCKVAIRSTWSTASRILFIELLSLIFSNSGFMSSRLVTRCSTSMSNTVVSILGRPATLPDSWAYDCSPQRKLMSVTIESTVPVAVPSASTVASTPHSTGAQ